MPSYIELCCHSAFSFGDGACTPEALVARAAELGYAALGLTDRADLGGVIRFVLEAERQGIRPVIGAELVVDGYPTAFLARDEVGYQNLAALTTRSRVGELNDWGPAASPTGQERVADEASPQRPVRPGSRGSLGRRSERVPARGRPTLTFEEVATRAEGLYALTGPSAGELPSLLRARRPEEAIFALERWRSAFGDRLVVEVQLHHVSGDEAALAGALIELAERSRVAWLISNDPRYLDAGGRLVHDLLTALRAGVDVHTAARQGLLLPNGEWRLKSPREMARLWRGREVGLETTHRIALDCAFDLRWLRPPLPKSRTSERYDDDSYLKKLAYDGAHKRWGELDERQRAQLEHELGVIGHLGFAGFFLVMREAVTFAQRRGILCQGRGSAANSAVAYCLEITAVDPVRHGLLFERFLSEVRTDGRTEAPDIDVDFEMHRREEVLDHMYELYGRKHAAITCVTQTYLAPNAVRDTMRALGYPAELALRFSKRLHGQQPSESAARLESGLARQHGLQLDSPRGRTLLAALCALDGLPRLRSTHPGGFVLSSAPLGDHLPIEHTTMGRTIVQFDKDDLDAAGVPKFDFLGLGGLSAVHLSFDAIEKRTGQRLELYTLPPDDAETFEMIARGDTVGTFQIESRAQIQSILQTRPERLYDLVVQIALVRPGPIQARFVRPYTRRRRGLEPVTYAHPRLEPILRRTYGIPIFQEQAMAISMALGGFSPAEADELRRSMGHYRKLPRLQAILERLKHRIMEHVDLDEATAAGIIDDFRAFANYGFPESHSWSFALIAYATAYLKARYPAAFYFGLLNAWPMGFYSPATLVHDARRHGVTVLGPCMKHGAWECTLEDAAIAPAPSRPESRAAGRSHLSEQPKAQAGGLSRREGGRGRGGGGRGTDGGRWAESGRLDGAETPPPERSHPSEQPKAQAAGLSRREGGRGRGGGGGGRGTDGGRWAESGRPDGAETPPPERSPVEPPPEPQPALRIGWRFIHGLGERTRELLQAAQDGGPFHSIDDVVRRAGLSHTEALHLARAGAFEAFEPGRRKAAWEALRAAGDTLPLAPARRGLPFDPQELVGEERIFLDYLATGISVHGHPMEHLRARLDAASVTSSRGLASLPRGGHVIVAGLVVARQHPGTAKGTVFVLLEDESGFINVIVPAAMYERNRTAVKESLFLMVEGRFERDGPVMNVIGQRFRELEVRRLAHRSRDFR